MGRTAWWATVHGVAKSWTQLSNWHFNFHFSGVSSLFIFCTDFFFSCNKQEGWGMVGFHHYSILELSIIDFIEYHHKGIWKHPKKMLFLFSPSTCHEVMGPNAMIIFWMFSFKPAFSFSSFTFIYDKPRKCIKKQRYATWYAHKTTILPF